MTTNTTTANTLPALPQTIEHLPIDQVLPYARNSRTHSAAQVAAVVASMREFGFTNPVLIRQDGTIIAGHGRVMAAREIGLVNVPCIRLGHLTDAQARAYVIADNKLAELAGWDESVLQIELQELSDAGFDVGLTGFTDKELAELLFVEPVGNTDVDAAPALRPDAVSRLGDVWLMGDHRIMCGDSTACAHVAALMRGDKAQLMQTDPPYGIAYVENAKSKGQSINHADIENDELDGEKLQAFLEATIRAALPSLQPNCARLS